jgi:hypothetical protein
MLWGREKSLTPAMNQTPAIHPFLYQLSCPGSLNAEDIGNRAPERKLGVVEDPLKGWRN